jgi:hypothetical protein
MRPSINPTDHPDNFEQFNQWLNNFSRRNGGYFPTDIKRWWEKVESTHTGIRDWLGGVRRQEIFNLKSQQNPLTKEEVAPVIKQIQEIVPDYLKYYGLTDDVFSMPTIQQGSHNAFKVSKHCRSFAEIQLRYDTAKASKIKQLDKILSQLGELWARNRSSDIELEITVSTSPRSFVLLGHYGPDQDSCFRNGSDKTPDKFCVGQTENSFVLTIGKHKAKKEGFTNVMRCFGVTAKNHTIINLCNTYISAGTLEGDVLETIRLFLEKQWGDAVELHEDKVTIQDSERDPNLAVFHNPYGRWSLSKGKGSIIPSQVITINTNRIKILKCHNCSYMGYPEEIGWEEVDNFDTCPSCQKNVHKCDISGKLTFKELVAIVGKGGKFQEVHPDYAKTINKCEVCCTPHIETTEVDGKKLCLDCF